jgi:hypothetical protein
VLTLRVLLSGNIVLGRPGPPRYISRCSAPLRRLKRKGNAS